MNADAVVVGGGLVGSAIAYGLAERGLGVVVLDEGDRAFRAARGNFGLVWVQGKGDGAAHYARWTRASSELWAEFAAELRDRTGVDGHHRREGGFHLCVSERELSDRSALMERLRRGAGDAGYAFEILDAAELARRLPGVGPGVRGASFSPYDGHADPLALLRALHAGITAKGGRYLPGHVVPSIAKRGRTFRIEAGGSAFEAPLVILAAGLGTARLAPMVGLEIPVRPLRGQILVTERIRPFLRHPISTLRQTAEGTVMLGDSQEEVGFDSGTSAPVLEDIARRAVLAFPALAGAQVVRAWGALRVMTPDGLPIYASSDSHPGAFAAVCHSGVTLAAVHARRIAHWIAGGERPQDTHELDAGRFAVPPA